MCLYYSSMENIVQNDFDHTLKFVIRYYKIQILQIFVPSLPLCSSLEYRVSKIRMTN